jgi:hypothetical protein
MKKIIIAIHGLGNKPDEPLLRESWLNAIHEGLALSGKSRSDIPFEMVYWADISHSKPLDPAVDDPEDLLFLDEPYTPSQSSVPSHKHSRLYMYVLKFIEDHLDGLFLKKNLSETFPAASTKMMERFFSELDIYYTQECASLQNKDCSAKAATQTKLLKMLQDYAGYEILLISHSMGSIIAFDVLWDSATDLRINTFITMGSPLGLPPIVARNFQTQKVLLPHSKQPRAPECIWPHWYNLSDRRDTVALDHTLRDDYGANAKGLKVVDLLVTNNYEINSQPNPHKSFGYLRTPEAAQIIDIFLSDREHESMRGKCNLIVGNIVASTRRAWKKISPV